LNYGSTKLVNPWSMPCELDQCVENINSAIEHKMATPVQLVSSIQLPAPVAESATTHAAQLKMEKVLRSQCIKDNSNAVAIAPYQALGVCGPLITYHRAAALDVLEPCPNMSEEVSALLRLAARCFC
jgi:hypothetical protein